MTGLAKIVPTLNSHEKLERAMQQKVPAAKLIVQALPMVPDIDLALIDGAYPQEQLSAAQVEYLMDEPPYWAFCWASGQVMARYILDHPEQVRDKTIIDFGCGSAVVAIAASMAGAARSIALDIDPNALSVAALNAEINKVNIELCDDLALLDHHKAETVMLIADVFYERANIPLLENFLSQYSKVIIADSRVKPEELEGVKAHQRYQSGTVPDLAEASDFNSVSIYF